MKLARIASRQTRSETRLGLIKPGRKALIIVPPNQDVSVVTAIGRALKERGVDVDFIKEYPIIKDSFGEAEAANLTQATALGALLHRDGGVIDGSLEAYLWGWPQFLPADHQTSGPRHSGTEHREVLASKSYLEKHPEYQVFLGRSSLGFREFAEQEIGEKYLNNWHYETLADLVVSTSPFPDEITRLLEDRTLEILPWAEEVHVTEPEGTDLRFSLTAEEAQLWYLGAFEPPQIELSPFAGTIGLHWKENKDKIVIPDANGVIAGHAGHAGYYPRLTVTVEHGVARKAEGGGKLGELWRLYLENKTLQEAHYPGTPQPGFLYLFQGDLGLDPKMVTMGRPLAGRAGMIYWGFGIDAVTPEMEKYAEKNHLPTQHGLHIHTFFPTFEVTLRGDRRKVKITDKGHLTALDDPEIQALAARYGKAEEVLREEFIPQIPGINAPGDYMKDYAPDPLSYEKKFWSEVLSGR